MDDFRNCLDEFVPEAFVSEQERALGSTDCVGFWLKIKEAVKLLET